VIPPGSIFGPTQDGVPNPFVPHAHPWPTRYHGPLWHDVRAGGVYQRSVYQVPTKWNATGASPDGLGTLELSPTSQGMLLRLLAGFALGAAAALGADKTPAPGAVIASAAAAATVLFGPEGMVSSILAIHFVPRRKP
jgi:hypothetical protein